ncbi:MAG: AAA family ATPase [Myxococcota bacterium]
MRLLFGLLLPLLLLLPLNTLASGKLETPSTKGSSDGSPLPPSNVRAVLRMNPAYPQEVNPVVRIFWNPSPSEGVEQYQISIRNEGTSGQIGWVSGTEWRWESAPQELTTAPLEIEVRAQHEGKLSAPAGVSPDNLLIGPTALQQHFYPQIQLTQAQRLPHPCERPCLPAGTISQVLAQPGSPFIWIGTSGGGLARFNRQKNESLWFTSQEGLGGDDVRALYLDRQQEYLWIVTPGALTRLLVREPTQAPMVYQLSASRGGFPSSTSPDFHTILEDFQGRLLLGSTYQGLYLFDPRSGVFRPLSNLTSELGSLNAMATDGAGRKLWIASSERLVGYPLTGDLNNVTGRPYTLPGETSVSIQALVLTPDGILLAGNKYLWLFETVHERFTPLYKSNEEQVLPQGMALMGSSELWMATNQGVRHLVLNLKQKRADLQPLESATIRWEKDATQTRRANTPPTSLQSVQEADDLKTLSQLQTLTVDEQGYLWLGLQEDRGLLSYQTRTSSLSHYGPARHLPYDKIEQLNNVGESGIIVRSREGLVLLDLNRKYARWLPAPPLPAPSRGDSNDVAAQPERSDPRLAAVLSLPEGSFLVASTCADSSKSGHICVQRLSAEGNYTPFFARGEPASLAGPLRGMMLLGNTLFLKLGDKPGLLSYYLATGRTRYEYLLDRVARSSSLALEHDGQQLWVGTDEGLAAYPIAVSPPPQGRAPEPLNEDFPVELSTSIRVIKSHPPNQLWVGTERGVWYRHQENEAGRWQPVVPSVFDGTIYALDLDPQLRVWVATRKGLYRTAAFSDAPTVPDRAPSLLLTLQNISALKLDTAGGAWVGTEQGLVVVPPRRTITRAESTYSPGMVVGAAVLALLLLGLVGWRIWPTEKPELPRDPFYDSPELLTSTPLPQLPSLSVELESTGRLSLVLLRLNMDPSRWQKLLALAQHWPSAFVSATPERVEKLIQALAPLLGAELVPMPTPTRRMPTENQEGHALLPLDPNTQEPLDELGLPGVEAQGREGFDLGAPGILERRNETTSDSGENAPAPSALPVTRLLAMDQALQSPAAQLKQLKRSSLSAAGPAPEHEQPLLFFLRLPALPIRLAQRELPVLVVRSRLPEQNPAAPLQRMLREHQLSVRYAFVLNLSDAPSLPPLNVTGTRFVPLNERELRQILFSQDVEPAFVQHIIRHVRITEVSPYSSKGEVSNPSMFMGRKFEQDRITFSERATFSIVGARQIGKSSLMGALRRYYRDHARPEVYAITLTLQEDPPRFYRRIAMLLGKSRAPRSSHEFAEMLEQHHQQTRIPALFLIDEVDGLLSRERQQGYPVLTAMRRLQQQDVCWFVLAGYWELMRLGNDYHSPLYNMSEVIELGPLKPEDALELVISPMTRMGLHFENEQLAQDIVHVTHGHPHLIQFICNQLLERMTANRRPVFTQQDWQAVRTSDVLKSYVTRNFKSNAGLLDELIVYSTLAAQRFTHEQLEHALLSYEVDLPLRTREESVRKLKLVGILKEEQGRFTYALPLFREVLYTDDVAWFARERAQELKKGGLV